MCGEKFGTQHGTLGNTTRRGAGLAAKVGVVDSWNYEARKQALYWVCLDSGVSTGEFDGQPDQRQLSSLGG